MPLFVTVTPGTTVSNTTTLDATVLNLLGTPAIDVTGTVDGGSLSLSAGSVGTNELSANAVTNAKMATMVGPSVKGRQTGTGAPEDVTIDNSTVEIATVSSSPTLRVKDTGISYAKIQNTANGKRLIGRAGTAGGVVGEIEVGSGLSLSDGGVLTASNTITAYQSSSNSAIPASGASVTWAHGFTSQVPHLFNAYLVCTADGGNVNYSKFDEIDIKYAVITPPAIGGWISAFYLTADNTNLILRAAYRTAPIYLIDKTTGVMAAIDTSKWGIKFSSARFSSVSSIP